MMRSLRRGRYFIAFFLTAAVFVIGILLGFLISDLRSSSVSDLSRVQRLDFESLQLQYLYISSFVQQKNCGAAMTALDKNLNDLEMTRYKLEAYISTPIKGNDKELNILKREYLLAEVRYWLFLKQTEDVCKKDAVPLLYFYSGVDCGNCPAQGTILTFLKDKFKEKLLVFAVDSDFDEPVMALLKNSYNITSTPTIVVKDETLEGLKTKEELIPVICKYFDVLPDACITKN